MARALGAKPGAISGVTNFSAMDTTKQLGGVELAKERKMKAQEALRISELEISLCKWQRRLHEMERRLQHCEETEVAHAAPCAQTQTHTHAAPALKLPRAHPTGTVRALQAASAGRYGGAEQEHGRARCP